MKKKFIKIFGALAAFILAALGIVAYNNRNTRVPNLYGVVYIDPNPNIRTFYDINHYVSDKASASTAIELINFINIINNSNELSKPITINITSVEEINPNSTYTITASEVNEYGCYDYITITENIYNTQNQ